MKRTKDDDQFGKPIKSDSFLITLNTQKDKDFPIIAERKTIIMKVFHYKGEQFRQKLLKSMEN